MICYLYSSISENQAHSPLVSFFPRIYICLIEVNSQGVIKRTFINLDSVVRSQLAQEWDKITIAVPFYAQLEVRKLPEAVVSEKSFGQYFVLYSFESLMMG